VAEVLVRLLLKVFIPLAVVGVLAGGLLPPLLDQAGLDTDALNAARAGSAMLVSTGSSSEADVVVQQSIADDPGVALVSVQVDPNGESDTMQVTVAETVHTYLSGIPGLKGWFRRTSTQSSSVGS
jgi:hypothetical protein